MLNYSKSIIVLGASGFIGSSLIDKLLNYPLFGYSIYTISLKNISEFKKQFIELNLQKINDKRSSIKLNKIPKQITVINCAAARRNCTSAQIKDANYVFPLFIANKILKQKGTDIRWIQLESYWQYSKSTIELREYVLWKNNFNKKLSILAKLPNFNFESVVLPHVIGANDDKNRFLNRIFSLIISNSPVLLKNASDKFYLCEKNDLNSYLYEQIKSEDLTSLNTTKLFPYYEISLENLVELFKLITASNSKITFSSGTDSTNPKMELSVDLEKINHEYLTLTPLEQSLQSINNWLA